VYVQVSKSAVLEEGENGRGTGNGKMLSRVRKTCKRGKGGEKNKEKRKCCRNVRRKDRTRHRWYENQPVEAVKEEELFADLIPQGGAGDITYSDVGGGLQFSHEQKGNKRDG